MPGPAPRSGALASRSAVSDPSHRHLIERGELGGGVFLVVHQVGDQAEHLRDLLAFHVGEVLDDADAHGDAVAGQLRPVGPVGQDLRGPLQRDVALEPDQHVRGPGSSGRSGARRGSCGPSARSSPGRTARGTGPWPRPAAPARRRPCPSPAGPCGIASSARHEQQVSGRARAHGHGPESSPVPTVPKNALFAGVSGTLTSVPSSDPAFSGLLLPMVTAPAQPRSWCSRQAEPQHDVPQLLQGRRPQRVPPVPGRPRRRRPPRPRPRDQRQVPGQRGDHVLDPGTGHQRHQHDHPDHERPASSRSRSPFTNRPSSARPPRSGR